MNIKLKLIFTILVTLYTANILALETVGWVEKAIITDKGFVVKAKIDSGARNSSLHCDCKKRIDKNGETWVKLELKNYKNETIEIEKKVIRQAKVKRHNGQMQIRDVIMLNVCLGSVQKEVEVNLVNREGLNYQMLIGRSFLNDSFLIDSGNQFINKPKCDF